MAELNEKNRYALLRAESVASVRAKYALIRQTSSVAEGIVEEIVQHYAGQLDDYVNAVDKFLDDIRDGIIREFAYSDLERMVLRLPILMYRLGDALDRSAIESDISKAVLEQVRAHNQLIAPGRTIPDKKAYAEIQTADEASIVDLTRHVYQRLKSKMEHASELFDGVRKVMTGHEKFKKQAERERN